MLKNNVFFYTKLFIYILINIFIFGFIHELGHSFFSAVLTGKFIFNFRIEFFENGYFVIFYSKTILLDGYKRFLVIVGGYFFSIILIKIILKFNYYRFMIYKVTILIQYFLTLKYFIQSLVYKYGDAYTIFEILKFELFAVFFLCFCFYFIILLKSIIDISKSQKDILQL